MDHVEMVALIRAGLPGPSGVWAELGAGTGNFTAALGELLGPQGVIYAVDRDAKAIARQRELATRGSGGAAIRPLQADFTRPLALPSLDGILMANALHFVRDQAAVLARIITMLRPGGRLVLVEYDVSAVLPWVPFPMPLTRFQDLAVAVGLAAPELVGTRRSPSSGMLMYAASALYPAANMMRET